GLSIVLNRWNGFASGAAFTLQLRPAYTNATATCNLQNACAHYVRIGVKDPTSVIACRLSNGKYAVKPVVFNEQTLTWNFRNWTGKTSTGSFSVSLEPGIGVDTAYCSLVREPECDAPAEGNNDFVEIILSSEISAESSIFLSNQLMGSDDCVSRIICNFTAPNGWHRIESVVPQTVLPSTIQIDLTTESSWSEESEIYFTATSYNTCSSARHQCQLRFDNGSTQFFESVSLASPKTNEIHPEPSVSEEASIQVKNPVYTDNIEVYVT
uniref:Ig-like domain-containing protein n=1 Tax=Macrostomum lignano TaxID=282301 RepID=A0A1I8HM97_9PLAT